MLRQVRCQRLHGRGIENGHHINMLTQQSLNPVRDGNSLKGITSQLEKIVIGAQASDAEHFLPDFHKCLLQRILVGAIRGIEFTSQASG